MLNLPSQPGTTGLVVLVCGAFAGLMVLVLWRDRVSGELDAAPTDRAVPWLVTGLLSMTIAAAPFTLWRVAVAPSAYLEIRQSLAQWLGYALIPRRQVRDARSGGWVVVWGATPADLGIHVLRTRLVGRNRLSNEEPVYVAEARS